MSSILVTGAAGFIGFHVARRLLAEGRSVVGVDNLCDYYSPQLKRDRLAVLQESADFCFHEIDLSDAEATRALVREASCRRVIHLAAQAGVRYSLEQPAVYVRSNLDGFLSVLEACRHEQVEHLVFASSSSVYGANRRLPYSTTDAVDHPISFYAATKKANEVMAHSYSHLYGLPTTGIRFFTVYGPWGRPDMAIFRFTEAILQDRPIDIYNEGRMRRDFTYGADAAEGVVRLLDHPAAPDPDWRAETPRPDRSAAPYRIYNLGNQEPVALLRLIEVLETCLGRPARRNLLPMQPGDVPETFADVSDLIADVGFQPNTSIEEGVEQFVAWYREYYGVS